MLTLTYITSNDGKFAAAREIFPAIERLKVDVDEIQTSDMQELVAKKLEAVVARAADADKRIILVEDAGVYFDGLRDFPGTMLKFVSLGLGYDGLLKLYRDFGCTAARPRIVVGLKIPGEPAVFFEGNDKGRFVDPRGKNSFGYAPYFQPDGSSKTYAEMDDAERAEFFYRGRALKKVAEYLKSKGYLS